MILWTDLVISPLAGAAGFAWGEEDSLGEAKTFSLKHFTSCYHCYYYIWSIKGLHCFSSKIILYWNDPDLHLFFNLLFPRHLTSSYSSLVRSTATSLCQPLFVLILPDTAYLVLMMFASVGDSQEFHPKTAESFNHALHIHIFSIFSQIFRLWLHPLKAFLYNFLVMTVGAV